MNAYLLDGRARILPALFVMCLVCPADSARGDQSVRLATSDPIDIAAIGGTGSVEVDVLIPASATAAPGVAQPAAMTLGAPDTRTIDHFKTRIAVMLWVHRLLIGVVVVLTAYTTFYAPRPAFGLATDYIALFLWGRA